MKSFSGILSGLLLASCANTLPTWDCGTSFVGPIGANGLHPIPAPFTAPAHSQTKIDISLEMIHAEAEVLDSLSPSTGTQNMKQASYELWRSIHRPVLRIQSAPKIMAFDGQQASVSIVEQQAYIQGYEVSGPQQTTIDPTIGYIAHGTLFSILPSLDADGSLQVSLGLKRTLVADLHRVSIELPSGPVTVEVPILCHSTYTTDCTLTNDSMIMARLSPTECLVVSAGIATGL
ncbi:MAG: hypothetical protein AB7F75_02700 [Planctomycetota bacterium]